MSSVPEGRAANHPFSAITLRPPIDAPLPGAWVRMVWMVSPASSADRPCRGESWASFCFCSGVAGDAIDHLAADDGLADCRLPAPVRPGLEQVMNGYRQIMVGRQQARVTGDDSVPVMIGVAGKGNGEAILQADQALHGIGRGWIHAYAAVPVNRHEAEGRIDSIVHDREVQSISLGDRAPVMHAGPTQRIHAQADARATDRLHVEHAAEIADISRDIFLLL